MLKMKKKPTLKPVKPMTFSSVQPVSSRTGIWIPSSQKCKTPQRVKQLSAPGKAEKFRFKALGTIWSVEIQSAMRINFSEIVNLVK